MWRVVTLIVLTYQDALVQFCLLFYGMAKLHRFRPQLSSNQIPTSLFALPAAILLFVILLSLSNDAVLLSFGLRDSVPYHWQVVVLHFLYVWVESWTWAAVYIRPSLLKQLICLERLTRQRTSPLSSRIRTNTIASNAHPTYEAAQVSESCFSLKYWFPCLSSNSNSSSSSSTSPSSPPLNQRNSQFNHHVSNRMRSSRYRDAKNQDRVDALCVLGIVSVVCILFSWLETTVTSPNLPQLASRVSLGVLAICGYGCLIIRCWYELSTVNTVDKLWMLLKESPPTLPPPPPQTSNMAITSSYTSRQSSSSAVSSLGGIVSSVVFQNTSWNLLLFVLKGVLLLIASGITLVYALPVEIDTLGSVVQTEGRLVLIVLNYVFRWFCEAWALINLRECLQSYAQLQPQVALENISSSLRPINPTMDERGPIPLALPSIPSSQAPRKSEGTDGGNIGVTFVSGVETYVDDTTSAGGVVAAAAAIASCSRPILTKAAVAVLPVTEQSLSVTGENSVADGTVHSLKPSERRLLAELNKIFPPPLPSPSSPTINTTNANVSGILTKHERVSSIDSLMFMSDRKLSETTTLKSDSTIMGAALAELTEGERGVRRQQWMFNLPSITSPVLSSSPGPFTGTTALNTSIHCENQEYPFPMILSGSSKDDDCYPPTSSTFTFSPSPPPRHSKSWSYLKHQQQQDNSGLQSSLSSPKFRIKVGSKLDLPDFGTGLREEDEDHEEEKV